MADYFSLILNRYLEWVSPILVAEIHYLGEFNGCCANELEEVKLWNGKELKKVK